MNATTLPKTHIKTLLVFLLLATLVAGYTHWRDKLPWHTLVNFIKEPRAAQTATASQPLKSVPSVERLAAPVVDHTAQVIVLGYHRFVDKVRHPDTEITRAEFEAQMQALKDQGIAVISMDDFLAWRHEQKSLPPRCALITIDDGYNVGYTVAWPILKEFGYPFTMFIYTDYVRGGPKAGGGSMTWEQLAEMRDAGVSIQSHTVSHPDLRRKKAGASQAGYDEWLWNELHGSKAMIEERLGIKVTALALPYGLANDHVREVAAKAGYEMVFTVNGEKVGFSTPMEALGRYVVQAHQPKLFKMATTFEGTPAAPASAFAVHEPHNDAPPAEAAGTAR
jgi:peptidoglycan/xylan/chitin deacetylase (PgdA/CDA1 family)